MNTTDNPTTTQPTIEELATIKGTAGGSLQLEIEQFPSVYGRQCELMHSAVVQLSETKQHYEAVYARLQLAIRKSAEISGVKTTEKKIESEVLQTQEYADAREQLTVAELNVEKVKLTLRALEKKERMLDLLGRKYIKEIDVHRVL